MDPQDPATYETPAKTEATPQDAKFKGMEIHKVENDGNRLLITVKADDPGKAGSPAGKELAWNERLKYGFANSGIEPYGGPFVTDEERARSMTAEERPHFWLQIFRLTPRL